jgi:hypothetical protein
MRSSTEVTPGAAQAALSFDLVEDVERTEDGLVVRRL